MFRYKNNLKYILKNKTYRFATDQSLFKNIFLMLFNYFFRRKNYNRSYTAKKTKQEEHKIYILRIFCGSTFRRMETPYYSRNAFSFYFALLIFHFSEISATQRDKHKIDFVYKVSTERLMRFICQNIHSKHVGQFPLHLFLLWNTLIFTLSMCKDLWVTERRIYCIHFILVWYPGIYICGISCFNLKFQIFSF